MDINVSLQDVLRCHLCQTTKLHMYCDICQLNICKSCEEEHISDESEKHKLVLFEKRITRPRCEKHSYKQCDSCCKQCTIPLCALCISSGEHEQHVKVAIDELIDLKSEEGVLPKNLQEINKAIYPNKQEMASIDTEQKTDPDDDSEEPKRGLNKPEKATCSGMIKMLKVSPIVMLVLIISVSILCVYLLLRSG